MDSQFIQALTQAIQDRDVDEVHQLQARAADWLVPAEEKSRVCDLLDAVIDIVCEAQELDGYGEGE